MAEPATTTIASLLRARRGAVAGTYTLTVLENICALAYPALTGRAVDDLVKREFGGLIVLVAVWLLHLVIAFVRQRVDTRVFMGLFAQIASHIVGVQQAEGHGISKVSARVEMVRDIVGFFEREVPAMFHTVLGVVGSLAMLFAYDLQAGFIAMAVLLPMGLGPVHTTGRVVSAGLPFGLMTRKTACGVANPRRVSTRLRFAPCLRPFWS